MGSAGSLSKLDEDSSQVIVSHKRRMPSSCPQGIEQQIPVEFKPRKKLGKASRHSHVQNHPFSMQSLSNSFTQTNPSNSAANGLKKKTTGTSLRSVLSHDTVLDGIESSVEVEKMRREFENFKLSKQNEIADMQKREKKLESENKRLRGEIQALQKTCTRLRNEREQALENESQALERARAFEEERNNILQQVRAIQESDHLQFANSSPPLQANNNTNLNLHDSEHGASDTSSNSPPNRAGNNHDDVNTAVVNDMALDLSTPTPRASSNLVPSMQTALERSSSTQVQQSYSESFKFEASVKPSVAVPPQFVHWPGNKQNVVHSRLNFVIGYFEAQLEDDIDLFMHEWRPSFEEHLLKSHGLYMNCNSRLLNSDTFYQLFPATNIIIIFLENKISEIDYKSLQSLLTFMNSNSSELKALFCFKKVEQSSLNSNMSRLKKLLTKANSNEKYYCVSIENYHQMEPLVSLVNESVDQFVVKHFSEGTLGKCCCHRDMHGLLYQKDLFSSYLHSLNSISPVSAGNIDQYVFCINRHIIKEGPVSPLILKSDPGCGKSSVLAQFLNKHSKSHPSTKILYHFTESTALSQDAALMMKRFAQALNALKSSNSFDFSRGQYSSFGYDNFSHLLEIYPRRNAKTGAALTSKAMKSDGGESNESLTQNSPLLIIAIDSADRLKNVDKYLEWIQDPLPVDVRVIVSVDSDSCPSAWMSMTNIQLLPSFSSYTSDLNDSLKRILVDHKLATPYFAKVMSKLDPSLIPTMLANISKSASSEDVGRRRSIVLDTLVATIAKLSDFDVNDVYKVLFYIANSHQGLSLFWIAKLCEHVTPSFNNKHVELVNGLCHKLSNFRILSLRKGNYVIASFMMKRFVLSKTQQVDPETFASFNDNFLHVLQNSFNSKDHLPLDIILESVDVLKSDAKYLKKLNEFVCRGSVFKHLYKYDLTHLILETFVEQLKTEKESISDNYLDEMCKLEQNPLMIEHVLDTMECLAAFNIDLGFYSKAAHLYQRCLEIRELNLHPDHPSLSRTFYLNALLHFKWDKIDMAETLVKQAIEAAETCGSDLHQGNTAGTGATELDSADTVDYVQVLQNFELLGIIYQRLGKLKQFGANSKRLSHLRSMVFIKDFLGSVAAASSSSSATVNGPPLSADILAAESSPDSIAKANYLNEHAVLMFYQGNQEEAEALFKSSLAIREKLLGDKHLDCSQSLYNLGGFYLERKDYSKSIECFERAVLIRKCVDRTCISSSLLTTYQWLIIAYRKAGYGEKALELLKDLVSINERVFGSEHQFVGTNYANMASIFCEMKLFSEALPLFEKALHIYTLTLGPNDEKVCDTLTNMALLKFELNEFETAVNYFRQAQERKLAGLAGLASRQTSPPSNIHLLTPTQSRHRRMGSDFQSQQSLNALMSSSNNQTNLLDIAT